MTTATTWRKERGRETEHLYADLARHNGWPYAEPVGAGRPGADITGMAGLSIEIKATRECHPVMWMRQARSRAGLVSVVWRPDGMGPGHIGRWIVMREVDQDLGLLKAAGYGDDDDLA